MSFFKNNNIKLAVYLLRLICKYYIAYYMFSYAFAKILKSQFDMGVTYKVDYPISELNGFLFTWLYYGFSREYGLVIAGLQILTGILIVFKKTERLGIVMLLSFMVNILLVNYFYEIDGAKSMSITLVTMGLFLLFSDWKSLSKYLFTIKQTIVDNPFKNFKLLNKIGWLNIIILPVFIFLRYEYIADIKTHFLVKNELFGVWRSVDNDTSNDIYKLYFDYDNKFKLKDNRKNMFYGKIEIDSLTKSLKINAKHGSEEGRYFLQDSLDKISQLPEKDSLAVLKKSIVKSYNIKNNTQPLDLKYKFEIKSDTLLLTNDSLRLKFLNISKNYNL